MQAESLTKAAFIGRCGGTKLSAEAPLPRIPDLSFYEFCQKSGQLRKIKIVMQMAEPCGPVRMAASFVLTLAVSALCSLD
jgi:hypothetical protein